MRAWFDSTTISQRVILLILVVGAILSGFFSWVLSPALDHIEALRRTIHQFDQEIQGYSQDTSTLVGIREEVQKLQDSLEKKTLLIPAETQETELRQTVAKVARKYRLVMTYWLPEPSFEESESRFVRLPFRVRIEGGYHRVAQFLNEVLLNPWVHEVSHVKMNRDISANKKHHLKTEFRLIGLVSRVQDKEPQLAVSRKL